MKTILLTLFVSFIIFIDNASCQSTKIASTSGIAPPVVLNYDELKPFNDGLAAFKRGTLWGFIDMQGKVVIEPVYTFEPYYKYGLIHVGIGIQRKAKIYDKEGNLVIDSAPYYNLNGFTDSLYTTACNFGDAAKAIKPSRYLLNRKGEIVTLIENENLTSGSTYCTQTPVERRIWFQDKMDYHKKGFLDIYGHSVIPAQFAEVKNFSNNRAWVKNKLPSGELRWGAIDTNGRVAIDFTYQFEQQPFKHYRCFVWDGGYAYTLIDTSGKILSDLKFKQATPFNNMDVTTVKIEENNEEFSMIIDYSGKVIKKFEKPLPGSNKMQIYLRGGFNNGLAIATYGMFDKFGAVDRTGKVVIPFEFDLIKDFNNGRALAVKTDKTGKTTTGIIDTHGSFVIVKMN